MQQHETTEQKRATHYADGIKIKPHHICHKCNTIELWMKSTDLDILVCPNCDGLSTEETYYVGRTQRDYEYWRGD